MTTTLKQFAHFLTHKKGARANTVDSYVRDVTAFASHANLCPDSLCEVSPECVQRYLDGLLGAGRSHASVRRAKASLRCFFHFALKSDNPAANVSLGPSVKSAPEFLSESEVERLLVCPPACGIRGLRDRSMLDLLYATGLKVSELVALNIDDVTTLSGYVRCKSEQNCRFIALGERPLRQLSEYLKARGGDGTQPLFLNARGGRMTRQGFWKMIKTYATHAEIEKSITPQTLRYSLAMHLYDKGAGKREIQNLLGYSDISSLQLYIKHYKSGKNSKESADKSC